jgi:hypothetical protein
MNAQKHLFNVMIVIRLEGTDEMDALSQTHEMLLKEGVRRGHTHVWQQETTYQQNGASLDAILDDGPKANLNAVLGDTDEAE